MRRGTRLHHLTRHILGLFHGEPGARAFRRFLTEESIRPGAGIDVLKECLARIRDRRKHAPQMAAV
jgi:tRNA-dihydrouridine synthase A